MKDLVTIDYPLEDKVSDREAGMISKLAKGNSLNRSTFALHCARAGPKPVVQQRTREGLLKHVASSEGKQRALR